MAIRHSITPALALAALLSGPASAEPLMRFSWNDCTPVVTRRDFTGPGVYTQTLSAQGLDAPITGFTLLMRIGSGGLPNAWAFTDLCTGFYCSGSLCQPAGRVSTLLAGTACDTIPSLHVSASYQFLLTPPWNYISFTGTADGSFTPIPAQRYTLLRIAFDHASSVAGPGGPGTCGGAADPLAFEIGEFTLNGVDQRGRATWENCLLTWNQPWNSPNCPLVVPALSRTWGQIKTLYR